MDRDLEQIDAAVNQETSAMGFFTWSLGVFMSAALGWLASSGLTPVRQIIFAVVTIVSAVFSLWFYAQWRAARSRRPTLLRAMRDQTDRAEG